MIFLIKNGQLFLIKNFFPINTCAMQMDCAQPLWLLGYLNIARLLYVSKGSESFKPLTMTRRDFF
ncbi:MAG: hypothetical protein EB059_01795 [Alphaproteobacteria bacterium]|nr:hypothetical protein [Alphaproteobacteria bacterium]